MADLYTPKRVCDHLGISASALRIYVDKYARKLSTEATTTPRKFTEADLHALAFVVASTKDGKTHDQVLATWEQEYPLFEWEATEQPTGATEDDSTALVPMSALKAAQALMLDAQRREEETREEARERERELQEHIRKLERDLGKAESTKLLYEDARRREEDAKREEELARQKVEDLQRELAELRASKPKGFWARLFGGGE